MSMCYVQGIRADVMRSAKGITNFVLFLFCVFLLHQTNAKAGLLIICDRTKKSQCPVGRPSPQVSAPKLQRLKQPSTGVSSGLVNSTVASAILVKWVSMTYAGCFNFDDARVIRAKYSRLVYVLHRVAQGDVSYASS